MINVKIDDGGRNLNGKIIRELEYFTMLKKYQSKIIFDKSYMYFDIYIPEYFMKSKASLIVIKLNKEELEKNLSTEIKICSFGAAKLALEIAKIFEEYQYENIDVIIKSDVFLYGHDNIILENVWASVDIG